MNEIWLLRGIRIAGWACIVVIAVLSLLPAEEMVRTSLGGLIEHALAYAGTTLLLGLSYRRPFRISAAMVAYAAVLEPLQALSPGRNPAVADWAASSVGALIGAACVTFILQQITPQPQS
ncbi:VanZ family protein [Rhodovastum atsumiense]|uniref:VanZ family protein n=1 Tax=Rhodovastum atsumiense TaxID=504468 RepID=A0A5M6J2C0_9PROT|nr:hypothetical protein [Rhodovastum atsumiense]KAA5614644.1 hypothetical protein F1189_00500 [Rhodovastum atsumiense]